MKVHKSFLNKLIGRSYIEIEKGDIFYFNSNKGYWICLEENPDNMVVENGIEVKEGDKLYKGVNGLDYIQKIKFSADSMYEVKVSDTTIKFHFKFKHSRLLSEIEKAYKSGDAVYITTISEDQIKELMMVYTLYNIKENNKRS